MVKTLTKHGNSLALVIDKPILDLLKIEADTPLSISTDGRCLIIDLVRALPHQTAQSGLRYEGICW